MIIPAGYAQANFIYAGPIIPLGAQWTIGLDVSEVPLDPAAVAGELATNYDEADFESVIATGANLQGILVKFGPTSTGPSAFVSYVNVSDGGAPSDYPGLSTLVRKQTALGGRAGRGRLYLPTPPAAGTQQNGLLEPTFQAQVQTRFNDFLGKLEADSIPPVVLHGAGAPLSTPTPITNFLVDARVGTQRRRNRR